MGRSTRRGPWLPEEDETLIQLVHLQGPNNWVRISQHMRHRSPKQCRERYHQNLKPSLNHEPISPEEGEAIEQLVQDMGKRWAEIARRLGNRSDNAVKNWWNGSMNRRKRHHGASPIISRGVGPRSQPIPTSSPSRPQTTFGHRYTFEPHPNLPSLPQFDVDAHRRAVPMQQPYLPGPEPRGPSAFASHSAPPTAQNTPDPFSLRSLHPQPQHSSLRPPPLESRHSFPVDWQPSAISPAATEFSSIPSAHQAPSLISDNLSHYSISPKTVSSPRPSLPAPIDTSTARIWNSDQRRQSWAPYSAENKYYNHDEGYVSALPPPTAVEHSHSRMSSDVAPEQPQPRTEYQSPIDPRIQVSAASSPTERDSRMKLSSLLD